MKKTLILISSFLLFQCANDNPADQRAEGEWLINREQVFDGGPGKDGIPALSSPQTASVGSNELSYLNDDDLVLAYKSGNEIKAYPHRILDWHEIANDQIGSDQVAITYCPLTGTGIGWGRELNGQVTTFGVSGLLFETNLMPYDRLTDSYWNQMFNQCVNGSLAGEVPGFFNVTQMSYGALKAHYPEAQVVTTNTGFSRDYQRYPYGSYLTNTQTIFPVTNFDTRIHPKEFVRGVVIDNAAAAFRFPETGRSLEVMTLAGQSIVVVADRENDFIVSFLNQKLNEEDLNFTLIEDGSSSNILEDQFGNVWNIFGEAVSGPDSGEKLEVPYSYMGFWFAWFNFFPDIVLSE